MRVVTFPRWSLYGPTNIWGSQTSKLGQNEGHDFRLRLVCCPRRRRGSSLATFVVAPNQPSDLALNRITAKSGGMV